MQQVITAKQAKQITGGRTPLVPVVYEQAVKALAECLTLDDAKQWDNKADALAAWAKIYSDGKVERQAKALKLLAYKRMGDLAREIRGDGSRCRVVVGVRGAGGSLPGARAILKESGLNENQAHAALELSRAGTEKLNKMVGLNRPPSPLVAGRDLARSRNGTPSWQEFVAPHGPNALASRLLKISASGISAGMTIGELQRAFETVIAISEWCDEFLQHCEARLKAKK